MVQSVQMADWFKQSPGKDLLAIEQLALQSLLAGKFGYHALQLERARNHNWLESSLIPHKIFVSPTIDSPPTHNHVCTNFTDLPFARNSIDLAVVPHVLEFSEQPQEILQEIYTALIPEGYVVILSYNALSLWGVTKWFKSQHRLPWHGRFFTSFQLRRWLTQIGYEVIHYQSLFFRPPLTSTYQQEKLLALENIGKKLWPYFGAVCVIMAQKRVAASIPISVKDFSKRLPLGRGATQPTRLNR